VFCENEQKRNPLKQIKYLLSSSSSSKMALQSNADHRLFSSSKLCFLPLFPICNFAFINICFYTFLHLFFSPPIPVLIVRFSM